ncbi:MAG TPA: hypothetical protein VJM11_02945, partial [Nevskiaceae bacterium]|nr:hypothetical protein [Nevskiaceae bacterium]
NERLYVFAQPLMREIAYGAQLETHRARMHARLAQILERGGAAAGRSIAHHWAAAGEWQHAGQWNLQAASWLAARDARACAEQYQLAVAHLDKAPITEEVRRLRIAARAGLIRISQFWNFPEDVTCRAYEEAHRLAEESGDPTIAAELMISFGNEQLHRGRAERSVSLVREAFRLAPEPARPVLANRFRLAILMTHSAVGRIQDGVALSNEMGGDRWLTGPIDADNHLSRGFMVLRLLWTGELRRAMADLEAAIGVAVREGRSSSWMHAFRVDAAWFSGDPTGVLDAARRAMEQAEAFGSLFFRAVAFRAFGEALCLLGRHQDALAPLLESRPLTAQGAGAYQFEANHLAVLCEAGHGAGRLEDAAEWGRTAVESAQRSGSRLWELRAWAARLALPESVLPSDEARAGFDRAWGLVDLTQAEGLRPKLEELSGLREQDPARRRQSLQRAVQGYERIGAAHHAERLSRLL